MASRGLAKTATLTVLRQRLHRREPHHEPRPDVVDAVEVASRREVGALLLDDAAGRVDDVPRDRLPQRGAAAERAARAAARRYRQKIPRRLPLGLMESEVRGDCRVAHRQVAPVVGLRLSVGARADVAQLAGECRRFWSNAASPAPPAAAAAAARRSL